MMQAYAKINLTLEVTGKYEDGYHQIATVMQAIDLHDIITFQTGDYLELVCNIPELNSSQNLVFRAARLLQEASGANHGAKISLDKSIPLASGLGGGSSDAATTLRALNELWGLNFSPAKLVELGMNLGSDVPFFLGTPTALVKGRGEQLTPLPSPSSLAVVLIVPPFNVPQKTRRMYASLKPSHFTNTGISQHMVKALKEGEQLTSSLYYNVFERAASALFPGLEVYRQELFEAGATSVHLAGSGPTLFTIMEDRDTAEGIYNQLKRKGKDVYLAQTLSINAMREESDSRWT